MLPSGARLGPYEVVASLGAGGMGEVYRARDARLDRDVAIKVLPVAFAADASRVARFEQEARAIAALSHPNVLAVFDTGLAEVDGARHLYVVTELLEGGTLARSLESGALLVRKAIEIGVRIARGLAAAHERGIVHRDLKPENVFVTVSGHVKILDFGLARPIAAPAAGAASETRAAITDAGTVLGTVGYMAPEQVRGEPVDARADLFALGAVLYETLIGRRAFRRDTPAETMTAILKEDPPDLAAARTDITPALDRIVRHCLEKNREERFQTARDVAFALEALSGSGVTAPSGAASASPRLRKAPRRLAWAALAALVALLAASALWVRWPAPPPPASFTAMHRATLLLPDGVSLPADILPGNRLAISPDGLRLAFVGVAVGRGTMLWLQSLSEANARLVEGSEGASSPFWSPDSRVVAFRQGDRLMKLDVLEAVRPVALGPMAGSGSWARGPSGEDVVVTSLDPGQSSMVRQLSLRDGSATDLLPAVRGLTEVYLYPFVLPGGRHILFGYARLGEAPTYGYYLSRIGSREKALLAPAVVNADNPNAFYASGYLLTSSSRTVVARAFDLATLTVEPTAHDVAGPIEAPANRSAAFSVSQNGVLVYQPPFIQNRSRLTVVDRTGRILRTLSDDAEYSNLELSPDGSRLAVSLPDQSERTRDIWVVDIERGARSRVTFDPSNERSAVWSPDGKSLVYTSKGLDLYAKPLGAGSETPLIKDGVSKDPRGWSPDGRFFVYRATGQNTRNDLWIKPRGDDRNPYPFLATPFDENYAVFSPDGRWLAYASDESGRSEVYVTAFPSGEGKWPISTAGGTFPCWRHDGREIVYLAGDRELMSATVTATGASFSVSAAEPLFQASLAPGPGNSFVMSADGQRFVINAAVPSNAPASLVLVYNWPQLLPRR